MQADMGRGRCEIAANTTETDNHAALTTAAAEGFIQYRTVHHSVLALNNVAIIISTCFM